MRASRSLLDDVRREERRLQQEFSSFRRTRRRPVGMVDLPEKRWAEVFDAAQKTSLEQHQEVLLGRLAAKSQALAEARARIQVGAYGLCARCGCRIPARRLKALPTATLCVACQECQESRASV